MKVNNPAVDKKARRKANRKQRLESVRPLDLCKLQKRAEKDMKLRVNLLDDILNGDPLTKAAARKAKRALNVNWTNRNQKSLTGFWNNSEV